MATIVGKHAIKSALTNDRRLSSHGKLDSSKKLIVSEKFRDTAWLQEVEPLAQQQGYRVERLTRDVFRRALPEGLVHQNVALITNPLPALSLEDFLSRQEATPATKILLLDQVTDPQNVGAILRSCACFGVDGIIIGKDASVDLNAPSLVKSASGAAEIVPCITVTNIRNSLEHLKEAGYWVFGLDEGGTPLEAQTSAHEKSVFALGAEGRGLRKLTRASCDAIVSLPTQTAFSTLNVAATAAILCYTLRKD